MPWERNLCHHKNWYLVYLQALLVWLTTLLLKKMKYLCKAWVPWWQNVMLPGFFSCGKEESVLCLPFAWVQAIKLLIWWWCAFRSVHKEVAGCSFYSTLPCCQDPQFWDLRWCLAAVPWGIILVRQLCSYLPLTRKWNKGIYRIQLQCRELLSTGC